MTQYKTSDVNNKITHLGKCCFFLVSNVKVFMIQYYFNFVHNNYTFKLYAFLLLTDTTAILSIINNVCQWQDIQ